MGTKYTVKEDLINEGVISRVFTNTTFQVTAKKIQDAMCDMVESLWSDCTCDIETFTATSDYVDLTIKRTRENDEVTIEVTADFKDNNLGGSYGQGTVSIADVLPQNYQGKKWFKPMNAFSLIDEVTGGIQDFGFITFNDLSSYSAGVASGGDETKLFMPGTTKGSQRAFVFDGVDVNLGTYDLDEGINTNNYLTKSPKDLTLSGLNISVENMAQYLSDTAQGNKIGTVKFYLKGILL